jgi:ParB family transcriptional regulator, chromosome partitioning protein
MLRDVQINTNIEAFLATDPEPTLSTHEPTEVRFVPLEQIVPNPHQPRRQFENASLQELADSIGEHGILQPLLVRRIGPDRYELIAGERRLRAARLAGLTTVPVIVKEMTDREQAEVALIENLQRENLSPVETARAFRTLMDDFGLSQKELGERVKKSPPVISRLTRLLILPETILDALERGDILERHTRALLSVKNREQREHLCQQVLAEKLSVHETEQRVRAARDGEAVAALPEEERFPIGEDEADFNFDRMRRIEEQMSNRLATKMDVILCVEGSGCIRVEFEDIPHMVDLLEALWDSAA